MADVKANEREFMSQVTSWLNEFINQGSYPFDVVSSDPSIKVSEKKTKFPDILIWKNRMAGDGFCGWELKTPDTPVDDQKLLEEAAEKARAMKADCFVTWNMRDAVIWRIPQEGTEVTGEYRAYTYPPIYQVSCANDLWDESKKILLSDRAKAILDDLATLDREGHLHQADIDATYFVTRLEKAINTLGPYMHDSLVAWTGRYPKFRERLFDWAIEQAIARFEDPDFYEVVSRQVAYRLLVKILFYQVLRRFRNDIPKLELKEMDFSKTSETLKEFFEKARDIDYQAVFEEDVPDKVPLSSKAGEALAGLLNDLNRYNFSRMPQDVIGQVFEKLIPPHERHSLGQYFTNENLVDLINAFCIRSVDDKILDPTCGSGTFLIRAYEKLKSMGERDHKKLLSKLWGIDVARFPAALATMNLFRQNLNDYANFPKIDSRNFFDVKPGDTFEFPPPKATEDPSFKEKEKLPVFDGAVGNFPYIRQELIERRMKGYKKKLENVLEDGWKGKSDLFDTNGRLRLSGQADIYAYLFFHLPRFIKEDGGRMGIVTSNSWLDVAYGYELQRFFLKNFKIVAIFESRCEPWFEDAAINTIVTILERCKNQEERDRHSVKFIKIKKKLKNLIRFDMRFESTERFHHLNGLVHEIERKGKEYLKLEGKNIVNTLKGLKTYEDEDFRIRVVRQEELLEEIEKISKTAKWGKYLRAPEVYFEIMERCKDKLVPLEEVAEIRRGYTTGINEFFYLTEDKIKHWNVEKEYLAPVIKSPREAKGILLSAKDVECKVFLCHETKANLKKGKSFGALKYIEWGEKQKTKEGIAWPNVSTVSGRKLWYDLGEREPGKILLQMITNDRFFAPYNTGNVQVDHNLFELFPKGNKYSYGLGIYLNSTIAALFRELISRINLGEGATKTEGIDWQDLLSIDGEILKDLNRQKGLLEVLQKRPIKSIFEEVKEKDRQKLDSLVLKAVGLDPKKYLKPIYDGLCELVRERIELAKMRKGARKVRTARDVEKIKDELMGEILPEGPKKFPEEFLPSLKKEDFQEISISRSPLKLGRYFFGRQEVISEDGFSYQAKSIDEAKFIIYSQRPDTYLVKIPRDDIAVSKAVTVYEKYLRALKDEFFEAFFRRIHDHKQSDALTQVVFEELGLPEVLG